MAKLKGTYALALHLETPQTLLVGRLGVFSFPPGYYLYLGSALGSLAPRLERHLAGSGRRHWHIDYLRAVATPVGAAYAKTAEREECRWARAALALPGATVVSPRFGASDCRCAAHLFRFPRPPLAALERALGQPLRRWPRCLP
ncbi:MAG: GIY-YIG nuclease family protein [Chloroflexi bacterium]|nr:GIY-YIG nuclease family protein [Chloroflexota bacterium]